MNLNLFGTAGLGYLNMGDINTLALNLGLGQNLFLTQSMGLRLDLRWLIFQGPNATSKDLTPGTTVSSSGFEDRLFFNTQLGLT